MNSTLETSVKNASKTMDEAKETAGKTAHRARSAVLDGLHAVASTFTALRGLGIVDALGWVGLQRRRGPATSLVTFGAGFLAGAATGVLFAPFSGAELRAMIVERATNIGREAGPSAVSKEDEAPNGGQPMEPTKNGTSNHAAG
jgi:hypothetical protein